MGGVAGVEQPMKTRQPKPLVPGTVSRWLGAAGFACWARHYNQDGYSTSPFIDGVVEVQYVTVAERPAAPPTETELVMLARYAAVLATKGCAATMRVWNNCAALYVRRGSDTP